MIVLTREDAARFFAQAVENLNGQPLTVGMLRDWLDACTTDDDELSFWTDGLCVKQTVPNPGGGIEMHTYVWLEEDGSCYTMPLPKPKELGPILPFTTANLKAMLLNRVTKEWTPRDDEPDKPGWTIHPPVNSEEGAT